MRWRRSRAGCSATSLGESFCAAIREAITTAASSAAPRNSASSRPSRGRGAAATSPQHLPSSAHQLLAASRTPLSFPERPARRAAVRRALRGERKRYSECRPGDRAEVSGCAGALVRLTPIALRPGGGSGILCTRGASSELSASLPAIGPSSCLGARRRGACRLPIASGGMSVRPI